MRHYYNFIDIMTRDFETPIIRYAKVFAGSWITAFAPVIMLEDFLPRSTTLPLHKMKMSMDFHNPKFFIDQFR